MFAYNFLDQFLKNSPVKLLKNQTYRKPIGKFSKSKNIYLTFFRIRFIASES